MPTGKSKTSAAEDLRVSKIFKEKLKALGCPYTDGVDESWIMELIFSPGEPRIQLLQWLFARMDDRLHEFLEPSFSVTDPRIDGRLSRLLMASSSLGLCTADELDVITGTCSRARQTSFVELLLGTVCTIDAASDTNRRELQPSGLVGDATSLEEQFEKDCIFIDLLTSTQPLAAMFPEKVNILQPDLKKAVRAKLQSKEEKQGRTSLPDVASLLKELDAAADSVHHEKLLQKQLEQQLPEDGADAGSVAALSRQLKLTLSESTQLLRAFCACVDSELRSWCRQRLGQGHDEAERRLDGARVQRLLDMLQNYNQLLKDMSSTFTSHRRLCSEELSKQLSSLQDDVTGARGTTLQVESIAVLENSIQRLSRG